MKLINVRILGFRSFHDSGTVEFRENINLIVGQNNSGKSAVLQALVPPLPNDRHRNPNRWEEHLLEEPRVNLTFETCGPELKDWIARSRGAFYFPITRGDQSEIVAYMENIFQKPSIQIAVSHTPSLGFVATYPSHQYFRHDNQQTFAASIDYQNGHLQIQPVNTSGSSNNDGLPKLFFESWQHNMFYFDAQRMPTGEAPHGRAERLTPTADNLPNVLHTLLNERRDIFIQLVQHLQEIFPTVANLSVPTTRGRNLLEVRVWPTEEMKELELSFPLKSSGTGVAQVIAILTAIITNKNSVVIIDEINNFLHPAAVKALLRIIQSTYLHHQYIISTHAPEVISFSNPKSVHLVKRIGYASKVESLDISAVETLRGLAAHLGFSLADVFAAERVIWVEGPTEELCFPYLYQKTTAPVPKGTIFASVIATGDFIAKGRTRELVYEVYTRLSAAASTFVVEVAFSFDSENLTDHAKDKMRKNAQGRLHFLPRRHFECYLIDAEAISAFLISKDASLAQRVTVQVVVEAIKEVASLCSLRIPEWDGRITNTKWLSRVDAAKLIHTVCAKLSDQRVIFSKKDDSLFILRHILEQRPDQLSELITYVKKLVSIVN